MNLKDRYDTLRHATLQMVGVPTDNLDALKKMAVHFQIPATHNSKAAASLLALHALIATHGAGTDGLCVDEGCPHHAVPHICINKQPMLPQNEAAMIEDDRALREVTDDVVDDALFSQAPTIDGNAVATHADWTVPEAPTDRPGAFVLIDSSAVAPRAFKVTGKPSGPFEEFLPMLGVTMPVPIGDHMLVLQFSAHDGGYLINNCYFCSDARHVQSIK